MMRKVCSRDNDYEVFRSFIEDDNSRKLLINLIRDTIHFNKNPSNRDIKLHAKQLEEIYGDVFKYLSSNDQLYSDKNVIQFLLESESPAGFVINTGVKSKR